MKQTRFYAVSGTALAESSSAQQQILFTVNGMIRSMSMNTETDSAADRSDLSVDIFYNGQDHFASDGVASLPLPMQSIQQGGAPRVRYERPVGMGVTMGVVFVNDTLVDRSGTVVFEVEEER